MSALLRKSVTDITRRKLRSILIIIGIAISVLGLTAIFTANDTISHALSYSADRSTAPDIEITVEQGSNNLTSTLKKVSNVKLLQVDSLFDCLWNINKAPGQADMAIYGYDDMRHVEISPFELISGRYPHKGEIVLEAGDTSIQSVFIGNTITLNTSHGNVSLKVVGFTRTLGLTNPASTGAAQGYVSNDTITLLQGTINNHIQVKAINASSTKLTQTINALSSILVANHVKVKDAHTDTDPFELSKRQLNGFVLATQVLAFGALILTCFLIINIMSTLIAEQTKIIGTMKAIGGTRGKIMRSYLFSVLIYGLIGTLIGIPLGVYAGYRLTLYQAENITLIVGPYQLSWQLLLLSLIAGIAVPLVAAIIPLWNGTSITVRNAISAYGVKVRGRIQTKGSRLGSMLPQTFWLGWRGTFRKPARAFITLIALILAGIAFFSVQIATYSIQQYTLNFYAPYNYDVWATVRPQPLTTFDNVLQSVPNVQRVERFGQQAFTTKWGVLQVKAVDVDTQLYTHHILGGRWLQNSDTQGLVLSDDVFARTGLHVGDTITLTDQQNTSSQWHIVGSLHDASAPSGSLGVGITSVSALNQFKKVPTDQASSLIIQATDRSSDMVKQLTRSVSTALTQANLNGNVQAMSDIITQAQNQFQPVALLLYAFASLIGCVGLLTLINLLTTSVLERSREIGIWRSMGATGRSVAGVFWIEGASLSILAWFFGVLLGIPVAYVFVTFLNHVLLSVSFAFDPLVIIEMLAVILGIMSLASIGPALNAAHLRIVDILRYE